MAHGALQQEHALAVQRIHDLHLLVLRQTVHRHGIVRNDGGDDAGSGAGDGGGIGVLVVFHDEVGAAGGAGGQQAAAQVHDTGRQLPVAAAVKVDAQQAHQTAVGILDEQGVGAQLLSGDGGAFKPQHVVLRLIEAAGQEFQHLVAEGGA